MKRLAPLKGLKVLHGQFSMWSLKTHLNISFRVFLVFIGFLSGNLIGQLDSLAFNSAFKQYLLLVILIFVEIITWFKFVKKSILFQSVSAFSYNLDVLKRGFLLGVCIEAFKVGS